MASIKTAADIIETDVTNLSKKIAETSGGSYGEEAHFSWSKNAYSTWYSFLFNITVPESGFADFVSEFRGRVERSELPNHLLITDSDDNLRFREYLKANNFSVFAEQRGMDIDLRDVSLSDDSFFHELKLIESDFGDIEKWTDTVNTTLSKDDKSEIFKGLLKTKNVRILAHYIDDKIVATSMMDTFGPVVGVHEVGTLQDFRGRGFASCLVKKILFEAKKAGYESCVLQASDLGREVYKKIGFEQKSNLTHWKYSG